MPDSLKKLVLPVIIVLNLFALVAGYTIANQQKSTGPAYWNTNNSVTISGLLKMDPYPVLHRINPGSPGEIESILLVNPGKYSADKRAEIFEGQFVSITGFPITRGGWTMLELIDDTSIVLSTDIEYQIQQTLIEKTTSENLGAVNLTGEVIDSKCFLGVMKPGSGSVHKACAEVCLLGGIPAMLLVRGENQKNYGYMLTNENGGSLSKELSSRAAESIEVAGILEKKGDLLYIKIAKSNI